MLIPRHDVVEVLRVAGLPDLAEQARRVLSDPVEYEQAAGFLAQCGITKDELISRAGGSP